MAGITSKYTFYVLLFTFMMSLMQNLAILPAVGLYTMPDMNTGQQFNEVTAPSMYTYDSMLGIGGIAMVLTAVKAFFASLVNAIYVFPVITNWGLPLIYATIGQGIIAGLVIWDVIALWRGYEIL